MESRKARPAGCREPSYTAGCISLTLGYYAAFVALGLAVASLGPTLTSLAENTRSSVREISLLFTARSLGYLLGTFSAGRLYDRVPGHPLIAAMLVIVAVMMALIPLIPLLWLLALALLILGMADGAVDIGGNTLLVWVHGRDVGPFMNGLHFSYGVGAFLAPIIVAQAVLLSNSITWAYWSLALLVLFLGVWLLRLPSPSPKPALRQDAVGHATISLVALFAVLLFLTNGAEASFGGWIFTYATAGKLAGQTSAAYLTSAFFGAIMVGRLLAIPIAARFRPRFIMLGDLLGCLVSVAVILLWPNSEVGVWLGTLGMGAAIASLFPTALVLAARQMRITGRINSWFFLGASCGAMTLPWLIGQFFEAVGPQVVMLAILLDITLAIGVFLVLMVEATKHAASTGSV